jgi:hypothetical protein
VSPYVLSVLRGQPSTRYVAEMPFVVRLHIFAGLALLAVIPLAPAAGAWISGPKQGLIALFRPIRMGLARAGTTLGEALRKYNPALWLWPDEE